MKKHISIIITFILIISGLTLTMEPVTSNNLKSNTKSGVIESELDQSEVSNIFENLNKIDGYFTENRGQINENAVKYYIQGKGVWFLEDGVVFEIREKIIVESRESEDSFHANYHEFENANLNPMKSVVLKLNFEEANEVIPKGQRLLPHESNFFYGNESSKWCTNVPNYQEIIYENLYDNIDLRYYSSNKGLKYDFIIHPNGDPSDIVMSYEGAQELHIDSIGNLRIQTPFGDIVDSELFIYQNINNIKTKIEGKFTILDSNIYGFKLMTEYDLAKELVIDPLVYSTLVGSTGDDWGYSIKADSNGNAYITGCTDASDFPYTPGAYDNTLRGIYDVFMFKLNLDGSSLMYSTFIGGTNSEFGQDLVIDTSGNAYITGFTNSNDFPCTLKAYCTSHNGGNDVFLLKLNPAGLGSKDLEYSTYLGGINDDSGYSVAIDSSCNAYVTGETWSSDFPTYNAYNSTFAGIFDAFVAKLNLSGNNQNDLIYSTFIGGTYTECGYSIAVDSIGNAYITGNSDSTDFPTFPNPGAYNNAYNGKGDGFIIKLNSAGSNLLYSTYFGGNDYDESYGIAIDSSDNVYVTGRTYSTNFPTTIGAYDSSYKGGGDVFVLKLNLTSSLPSYSTYISDTNNDIGMDIDVDSFGNTYITGYTSSTNFPTTASNAYDTTHNGEVDVIVIKLNNAGSNLVYSTYIGGADSEWGYGIAIDPNCKIYVTGLTESSYFPNTTGVNHSGSSDCFIVKLEFNNIPQVVDLTVTPSPVFRANSIYIYSNATDGEDLESELAPTFEYRDPGQMLWLNESLSTPTHINNRWQTSRTITIYDPIGEYDFRVRYKDQGLLDSEWFYSNKVLKVLNNLPEIKDLNLSKDKAFQKENISLWVNGSDVEDPEYNLTLWVEYRDPSDVNWNISYLKLETIMYVGDKWEINFSAPFDAPFGYYDFRANITDSDGNYSGWFYAYDALLVSNKNPEFLDVGLSNYTVYRNNSVFLYSNCSDHETPKNELKYQAEYKYESDTEWSELLGHYSDDRWESKFDANISSELGFYNFRVKFEDSVEESTGWQEVEESLEVLNNLPKISFALDDIEIETNTLTIDLTQYESDVEDTNEDLIWSIDETKTYKFLESVRIKDQLNDILEIVPKVNIRREEDIKLTLTDKDGGTDTLSNITISVDSVITKETPKLTLLTPADKNKINTLTPTLTWKLEPIDETVTYTIFLDEKPLPIGVTPDPNKILLSVSELTTTTYKLEIELENNNTYYWWVEPSWGITLSEPFSFTIDVDYKIVHDVELSSERNYIAVKQGKSKIINLTVNNKGNIRDTFELRFNVLKIGNIIKLDNKTMATITLDKGTSGQVQLSINVSLNIDVGEGYIIHVIATSLGNKSKFDEVNITVDILSRFFIPNYKVALEVTPTTIEIEQTKSKNVTLIIENTGNVADEYNIKFSSLTFRADAIEIVEVLVFIKPGLIKRVNVTITIPEDMEATLHTIIFKATSYETLDEAKLNVTVLDSTDFIEPSDGEKKEKEENLILFTGIGIGIIIIIVMLIILFLIIRKRREAEKDLLSPEDEEATEESKPQPVGKAPTPPIHKLPLAQPMKVDVTAEKTQIAQPPQPTSTPQVQSQQSPKPVKSVKIPRIKKVKKSK